MWNYQIKVRQFWIKLKKCEQQFHRVPKVKEEKKKKKILVALILAGLYKNKCFFIAFIQEITTNASKN